MERKKLIFLILFIIFSSQSTNYISLFEFSKKNSLIIKSNFDFGYVDLIKKDKNIRIFLSMPYILYEDKIKFMNENIILKNGEILIPLSYKVEIEKMLLQKPLSTLTNKTNLITLSSSSKISSSTSSTNLTPVKVKDSFKPMNCVIIDPGHGGKIQGDSELVDLKKKD
ncbi:MAG: hypothetical protein N2258_08940 [Brevinematales bacterium]|nr:hypothetical protein [Brevinematales bacterium]